MRKILVALLMIAGASGVFAQKIRVEDIIAKHLDSLGTAEARAAVKNRIAVGDVTAKFTSTKDQPVQGRIVIASEGSKSFMGMVFNSTLYPGERYIFDGNKVTVSYSQVNGRSVLGNFFQSNGGLVSSGLVGGALSTGWAPLTAENIGYFRYEKTKTIDGREAYAVGYSRKGFGDVTVTLYFDSQTNRHIRTEYRRRSSAGIGVRPEDSTRFTATDVRVQEDFSDFAAKDGITLPQKYKLFYSASGQNGTTEIEWNFDLKEFASNQKLDPATFAAQTN